MKKLLTIALLLFAVGGASGAPWSISSAGKSDENPLSQSGAFGWGLPFWGSWTDQYKIVNGKLCAADPTKTASFVYKNGRPPMPNTANQMSAVVIYNSVSRSGPAVCIDTAASTCYFTSYNMSSGSFRISTPYAGITEDVWPTMNILDTIKLFRILPDTLKAYINGTLIQTAIDATLFGGRTGGYVPTIGAGEDTLTYAFGDDSISGSTSSPTIAYGTAAIIDSSCRLSSGNTATLTNSPDSVTISPALPSGYTYSKTTGSVSGNQALSETQSQATYKGYVWASGSKADSTTFTIAIYAAKNAVKISYSANGVVTLIP